MAHPINVSFQLGVMSYGNADLGLDDAVKVFGSDFDVREPRVICATLKVNACIEFAAADEAEIAQQEVEQRRRLRQRPTQCAGG